MIKKYELVNKDNTMYATPLYRIKALISFGDVCAGDVGAGRAQPFAVWQLLDLR